MQYLLERVASTCPHRLIIFMAQCAPKTGNLGSSILHPYRVPAYFIAEIRYLSYDTETHESADFLSPCRRTIPIPLLSTSSGPYQQPEDIVPHLTQSAELRTITEFSLRSANHHAIHPRDDDVKSTPLSIFRRNNFTSNDVKTTPYHHCPSGGASSRRNFPSVPSHPIRYLQKYTRRRQISAHVATPVYIQVHTVARAPSSDDR